MKLPWVSRDLYEQKCDEARRAWQNSHEIVSWSNRETAGLREQLTSANARIDQLLDRALPVPSSPVTATAVREPRVPDVISKAIREEAGADTRLAAHLRKRAKELKTEHNDWTPQQIADELSNWQTTEHDGTE